MLFARGMFDNSGNGRVDCALSFDVERSWCFYIVSLALSWLKLQDENDIQKEEEAKAKPTEVNFERKVKEEKEKVKPLQEDGNLNIV